MNVYIQDLVEQIFSEQPKGKHEIQLSLVDEYSDIKGLFEFLLDLFTRGCKFLFADNNGKVQLELATDKEFNLMIEYFESFGIKLIIDKYNEYDMMRIDFDEMKYTNKDINDDTHLNELALPLKCNQYIFVIKFDYLLP